MNRHPHRLSDLADAPRWVAWLEESRGGKQTKVPKSPLGGNAKVPTNPKTYGTRAQAERHFNELKKKNDAQGGTGIVLGKLNDELYLVGIDLDLCRDAKGLIADWAKEVIKRFETYAEISPSGTGVKLFFLLNVADFKKLLKLLGTNKTDGKQLTRKAFAAGKHREVAIDTARFYAVTEQRLDDCPEKFRLASFADVQWFTEVAGPNYLIQQQSGNGRAEHFSEYGRFVAKRSGQELDESGSGYGFRFMQDCHTVSMSYQEAHEAILADDNEAGEWANRVDERQLQRAYERSQPSEPKAQESTTEIIEPVDLWAKREAPPLPKGLLPKVIEKFAFSQAKLMGCDPAGLAMGALTVCAAAIPDGVKLQVKEHDIRWKESTRLWTAFAGSPSVVKSPITDRVTDPLNRIDAELSRKYQEAMDAYQALSAEEKKNAQKPRHERIRIEDVTPEAVQPILRDSPNGVLLVRDELSGWFGSIDKYSGSRGGGMDRGFWLQAFNGKHYSWDRVGRGSGNIPNLSISVLGGIQEDPLRKLVNEGVDDGLIQRLFVIMLRPAVMGRDEPQPRDQYDDLVERLHKSSPDLAERHFSKGAQVIRRRLEQQHIDLAAGYEKINKKLAAHIIKYKGLFARLCLLWHCIETIDEKWPSFVDEDIAQRVADFMNNFLLQHAVAFYIGILGMSDQHDRLLDVGGYILAHKLNALTRRDIQRGSRSMREMEKRDTDRIFEQLEAYGWLERVPGRRYGDVQWIVNPQVHRLFAKKAKEERERRQRERAEIVASLS